jgi:hypothetical protein
MLIVLHSVSQDSLRQRRNVEILFIFIFMQLSLSESLYCSACNRKHSLVVQVTIKILIKMSFQKMITLCTQVNENNSYSCKQIFDREDCCLLGCSTV